MIEPQHLPMLYTSSMNDTHFEALQLMNELYSALDASDTDLIHERFEKLLEHTKEHYAHEEAMMIEKKFPPYPAHKEDHEGSLAEMEKEVIGFGQTKDIDALRVYVEQKLIPWFLRHTETMDAVTSIFLENSEAHLPYWERLVPRNK